MAEKLKRRSCSLCGKDNSRLFHILRTNNFDIEYVTCNKCGFIFQSKPFSNKELKDYYSHQYRKTDIKNGTPTERVLSTERARAKLVSAFLICHSIENFNFALDIGCSTGSLLKRIFVHAFSKSSCPCTKFLSSEESTSIPFDNSDNPRSSITTLKSFRCITPSPPVRIPDSL